MIMSIMNLSFLLFILTVCLWVFLLPVCTLDVLWKDPDIWKEGLNEFVGQIIGCSTYWALNIPAIIYVTCYYYIYAKITCYLFKTNCYS